MSLQEDYYESRTIQSGRGNYSCAFCHGPIPKGTSSTTHKFYPDYSEYRTHVKCADDFRKSEWCDFCGEPVNILHEIKDEDDEDYLICKDCFEESQAKD